MSVDTHRRRRRAPTISDVVEPLRLDTLAQQVMAEHELITDRAGSVLAHAITAGKLLLKAKALVPKGEWTAWLESNLNVHKNTAFTYVRLAQHEAELKGSGVTGIDPAMEFLSTGKRLTKDEKLEMLALYEGGKGMTLEAIAQRFGVRRSTAWYYVSAKNRDRVKTLQRKQRHRAQRALEREETRKQVAGQRGPLAKAYSEIRRALQAVDQHLSAEQLTPEDRIKLLEALDSLYAAEDRVAEVIRAR